MYEEEKFGMAHFHYKTSNIGSTDFSLQAQTPRCALYKLKVQSVHKDWHIKIIGNLILAQQVFLD